MSDPRYPTQAEVSETGDRMRFWVRSRSNPKIRHVVDLTANRGGGECSCEDWKKRRGPALRAGGKTLTRETTCWHVRQALTHFCRGLLSAMAESEETPPPR